MVLYRGRVMEIAPREQLYRAPRHPYTRALLAAVPAPDPTHARLAALAVGEAGIAPPEPGGCVFRQRCTLATARCASEIPQLRATGSGSVACHYAET
jgi:oligopeptide/dipeptide ABC transporter ATP-binding protein